MRQIPVRLKKDPIVEAVAEIRFGGIHGDGGATLLAGFLATRFRKDFPKFQKLPAAQMPPELLRSEADLRYVSQIRLASDTKALLVGDHSLAVSLNRPYIGWSQFEPLVKDVWAAARESDLLGDIERISLKYINFLECRADQNQLALTRVSVKIGDHTLSNEPATIRTELNREGTVTVIQVVSQASEQVRGQGRRTGVVVDIDTIMNGPFSDFWDSCGERLQTVHRVEKYWFYETLTDQTIDLFEPEY